MKFIIRHNIDRPPRELVAGFKEASTATIHEAMGRTGAMDVEIKPVKQGTKLVGPAFTLFLLAGDNLMLHKAMTMVHRGDVLVIQCQGGKAHGATWGALANAQAIHTGYAGVVTDGTVRDVSEIRKSGFPCFAKAIAPLGTDKNLPGAINVPITCGGVLVNPGDMVVGDDDGVVVVPKEIAPEVLKKAKERETKETEWRRQIKQGKTLFEIGGFEKVISTLKIEEIT